MSGRLGWCLPENTRVGRLSSGTVFSSKIRAGSQWALDRQKRAWKCLKEQSAARVTSSLVTLAPEVPWLLVGTNVRPFSSAASFGCLWVHDFSALLCVSGSWIMKTLMVLTGPTVPQFWLQPRTSGTSSTVASSAAMMHLRLSERWLIP